MNIKTILVPCDFSQNSEAGVNFARELARKFNAKVLLAHVSPSVSRLVIYGPGPAHLPSDLEDAVLAGVEQGFAKTRSCFEESDRVSNVHLRGEPHAELIRYANEEPVDLIVMSTRGHTGLKHLVLGSVAERVVRAAPCPVITIKPQEP
jgi:nucleotide-binding universal stress UspA family protein